MNDNDHKKQRKDETIFFEITRVLNNNLNNKSVHPFYDEYSNLKYAQLINSPRYEAEFKDFNYLQI